MSNAMPLTSMPAGRSHDEENGCRTNDIDVAELFQRYERAGFLHPAKARRLAPYMPTIVENWRRALRGGDSLLWFSTYEDQRADAWASLASWRATSTGWQTQHLVSSGSPRGLRAVLMASAAGRLARSRQGEDGAQQSWFRPENAQARRVFGSITETLRADQGWIGHFIYAVLPLSPGGPSGKRFATRPLARSDYGALREFVSRTRGTVYAHAEGLLDSDDFELDALDERYRAVGLRRYRRVFLCFRRAPEELVAVALASRGPLGLSFSFLENRTDLIVDPRLLGAEKDEVVLALGRVLGPVYADFPPRAIPIVTDDSVVPSLVKVGGEPIRSYWQSAWLQGGYEAYCDHVERLYRRVNDRDGR